jgi:HemY protein
VETEVADDKAEAVPFFGGAPDDPGVKKPGAEAEPKTRLKLF